MKKEKEIQVDPMEVDEEETPADDYKEKWQRAMADLENMRKRHEQERLSFSQFAQQGLLLDLLPVVDNFYRALEHVPADQQDSAWITGIGFIQKQLLDVLEQNGVAEIPAKPGEHFDATTHEAIGTAEEGEEDTIAKISLRGYTLQGKVLRPVQVIVTKKN